MGYREKETKYPSDSKMQLLLVYRMTIVLWLDGSLRGQLQAPITLDICMPQEVPCGRDDEMRTETACRTLGIRQRCGLNLISIIHDRIKTIGWYNLRGATSTTTVTDDFKVVPQTASAD